MEESKPVDPNAMEIPSLVLSEALIETAIVAWDDLYLLLVKQNKIHVDHLALAVIGSTLIAMKAAYPTMTKAQVETPRTILTRTKKDKPSDAKRPTR